MVDPSGLSEADKVVIAASNLVKRLPPNQVGKTLAAVSAMVNDEDIKGDLMDKINQRIGKCYQKNIIWSRLPYQWP